MEATKSCIACAISETFTEYEKIENYCFAPKLIHDMIKPLNEPRTSKKPEKFDTLVKGEQEDAHEFLLKLLQSLYDVASPPPDVFTGKMCTATVCKDCGHSSKAYDPIMVSIIICTQNINSYFTS